MNCIVLSIQLALTVVSEESNKKTEPRVYKELIFLAQIINKIFKNYEREKKSA